MGREILTISTVHRFPDPPALVIGLVPELSGFGPLPDQFALELSCRAEHLNLESRRGILHIGVYPLRYRDEADAVLLQLPYVVEAVHEGPPEPIQLPNQEAVEFPFAGVGHEPVQRRAAGFRSGHHVLVDLHDAPTLTGGVLIQFSLNVGILIRRAHPRVDRCSNRGIGPDFASVSAVSLFAGCEEVFAFRLHPFERPSRKPQKL
jgi:hypothetical protein